MEYIVINESKLKVVCEEKDLNTYGITTDSLEYGDASSRRFLEDMLSEAKARFGFETAKHRILIQLFPDSDGGCEIFISKLGLLQPPSENTENEQNTVSSKQNEPIQKIFFFESLSFLIEACKRLSFLPHSKNSSAFYIEQQGYYLYLEAEKSYSLDEYGITTLDEYSFLLEYGEPQNTKEKLPYLKEYAKCICKDSAVETLANI